MTTKSSPVTPLILNSVECVAAILSFTFSAPARRIDRSNLVAQVSGVRRQSVGVGEEER